MSATHEVLNQSAPLEDFNLYASNAALADALAFNLPAARRGPAGSRLHAFGADLGARPTKRDRRRLDALRRAERSRRAS